MNYDFICTFTQYMYMYLPLSLLSPLLPSLPSPLLSPSPPLLPPTSQLLALGERRYL